MTKVYAKHLPYEDGHLAKVYLEMILSGTPTLSAVRFRGELFLLEGSHRAACANELGLIPKLIVFEPDFTSEEDKYYNRIKDTLPVYEFDHVLIMNVKDFE